MFEELQPVIGPYTVRPAVCEKYDPRAADVARQVASLVAEHLPQIQVEHIGSTAVPGCAGKGIVDLMIAVPDSEMESAKVLLDRLGFQHQSGPDPFPENRPMRIGAWDYDGKTFFVHVHVILAGSPEVEEMRFFRACLRADPELVKVYVARKREIIGKGMTDPTEYCRAKDAFFKEVL